MRQGDLSTTDAAAANNNTMGFSERALSAAGAAFLSAILVNPLDVAKVSTTHTHTHYSFLFTSIGFN